MDEIILNVQGIKANRLLIKPIFDDQLDVLNVFKMYNNIKHGKERVHHLNAMSFDLVDDDGCGFEDTGNMNITDRTLHVYNLKGQLSQCYDEFKCTYLDELLGTGIEKADITKTQIQGVILGQAERALRKTYERLTWFGDRASENSRLNGVDGLWSVAFANGIASNELSSIDINSGSVLNAGDGIDILTQVWENSPNELKAWAMNQKAFYVSGSVYEQYMRDTEGQGLTCSVDQNYTNLVNGQTALTFRGIPVIPFYSWDSFYSSQGEDLQHRVLFTVPSQNIMIGTDNASDLNSIESRYIWESQKVLTRIASVFGVDYACSSLLSLGL